MMSLGYEVRRAGSHLPHFRQFQGLRSEEGGSLEQQSQKENSGSVFSLSLEGKHSDTNTEPEND